MATSTCTAISSSHLEPKTAAFYRTALEILNREGLPYLVGGAYALGYYTGIERHTKDFDIFVRPADVQPILDVLTAAGYRTELTFPHWLGKVYHDDDFVDVIYSSGNGIAIVDEEWFEHAAEGTVLGMKHRLCPAEEIIWSKSFVIERERYDGADIAHLIRARGQAMDWKRMLRRFDRNWRVLFSHLVLFGFIYPCERDTVPSWVMQELIERLQGEIALPASGPRVCQGTLLSRAQYLIDIRTWGYEDARLRDDVRMNEGDIAHWTAAMEGDTAHHVECKNVANDSRRR